MYTLRYAYSRPQLQKYFFSELWRTQGGFLLCLPLLLVAVIMASRDRDYWWFAGFVAGCGVTYTLLLYSSYRRLDEFPVNVPMSATLSDSGLHFDSSLIVSDLPWSTIRTVRSTRHGLVLTSRTTRRPLLIPAAALTQEIIAFVEGKVRHGRADSRDGA